MFTGLIETTGVLRQQQHSPRGMAVTITSSELDFSDVKLGDSIAVNGICLTVTALAEDAFSAELSHETLRHTTAADWQRGQRLNLEKALLPATRLGGHLVSGHVDTVVRLVARQPQGEAEDFWFETDSEYGRYLAVKGSVTIDGISLTVNGVEDSAGCCRFRLTLIPHTLAHTTLHQARPGLRCNMEVDLLARYVERLMGCQSKRAQGGISLDLLARTGFIED